MATHYEVLGLQLSASTAEVRLAFKQHALVSHPDKGGSKEAFQEALFAFEILSDSTSRSAYDASLRLRNDPRSDMHSPMSSQSAASAYASCKSRESRKRKTATRGKKGWCAGAGMKSDLRHACGQTPPVHQMNSRSCQRATQHMRWKLDASQLLSPPRFSGTVFRRVSRCPSKKMNVLLGRIFSLLRRLSPQSRRRAFERNFTQQQRLALEFWAKSSGAVIKGNRRAAFMQDTCLRTEAPFGDITGDAVKTTCSDLHGMSAHDLHESSEEEEHDEFSGAMELEDRVDADNDNDGEDIFEVTNSHVELENGKIGEVSQVCCNSSSEKKSPPRGNVRGVAWKIRRSKPYYQANVCMETFYLVSREVPELVVALDALVVLTTMKQRILKCDKASFEERVRYNVPMVLNEYGVTAEQLGLGFHTMISMRFWIHPPVHTPHQHSLDAALSSWSRLAPFRKATSEGAARELARTNPIELFDIWQQFRSTYLDILEAHGKCREWNSSRLDALEEAARPVRERRLERWNRLRMNMEDRAHHHSRRTIAELRPRESQETLDARAERRNQLAMLAEERRLRRLYDMERRCERRENRAMAIEDGRGRACRRLEFKEASLIRRIVRLLRGLKPLHRRLERYQERLKRDAMRVAFMSKCPTKRKRKS